MVANFLNEECCLLLLFLFDHVSGSCWDYSKSFKNLKKVSIKQMNAEAQREADRWKLEEFCKSFCFEDEKYKAVLLDTRNWYCWAFDGDEDERVRDSAEVAIAGRRCLEMQDGAYFCF